MQKLIIRQADNILFRHPLVFSDSLEDRDDILWVDHQGSQLEYLVKLEPHFIVNLIGLTLFIRKRLESILFKIFKNLFQRLLILLYHGLKWFAKWELSYCLWSLLSYLRNYFVLILYLVSDFFHILLLLLVF